MILYNEDKFKELLSEFILCSEQWFELLKEETFSDYVIALEDDLYELVLQKNIDIINNKLDPEDYGINNIIGVNKSLPSYQNYIFNILGIIFTRKVQIEILEDLRKCKSWKEIINLKDKFIEIFIKIDKEISSEFINSFKNEEGIFLLMYVMYLAQHGIYAIDDSLYNELNVSKKGIDRPRFDYARNGLPFSTKPYIHNSEKVDTECAGYVHNTMIKVEEEFVSYGAISPMTMSSFRFIASCHKIITDELALVCITKDKSKALIYRYIDILESSVLACSESYIDIDYSKYTNLIEFNNKYKDKVANVETVEELEHLLETQFESYMKETIELQDVFIDHSCDIFSSSDLFNLIEILTVSDNRLLSKPEVLVMSSHIDKLKYMFINFARENIEPLTDLLNANIKITEDKIAEIKENAKSISNTNVSTKKINKKIAKYKKSFHFKEINKLAEEAGFYKVRQNGDHGIFQKLDGTTVVIPQGRKIGKGLSYKIQKEIKMA